jgi:hypothetical protein
VKKARVLENYAKENYQNYDIPTLNKVHLTTPGSAIFKVST